MVSRNGNEETEKTLHLEGKQLQRVISTDKENSSTAFVGLHLNEKLDFEPHVNAMARRAMGSLKVLAMLKNMLPKKAKLQIFHSLIQSHLCLDIMASGRANARLINKLQVIQNRALRIVEDLPSRASCAEAREKHKVLTIADHYEYTNSVWAIKAIAGWAPETVTNVVQKSANFERNRMLLIDNLTYSRAKRLSPKESIAKAWNALPLWDRRHLVGVVMGEEAVDGVKDLHKYAKNYLKNYYLKKAKEKDGRNT